MRSRCRFERRARVGESGQALVEFALVVPIFILLLLGIVEFARAWNIYQVLTDAGREGARRSVVDNPDFTEDSLFAVVQSAGNAAGINIQASNITVTGFHAGTGETTTVRIEYEHELRWVGPILALATGENTVTMVSLFSMRNE